MALKILLLGCHGQVGWELQRSLAPLGEVSAHASGSCDLRNPAELRETVRLSGAEVIVNAAAYTAVDRAEAEAETAHAVNAVAPAILAEEARRRDALLVHYSTDYVFDGRKEQPYHEEDLPNPLSVYGRTKLTGEEAIRAVECRHLIFRTSWVFGEHGNNFVRTILRLAAERDTLRVVDDQVGAPTPAALIADVTALAVRELSTGRGSAAGGLYHLAAAAPLSWHGFATAIVEEARAAGLPLLLAPEAIEPIPSSDYPTPAHRPANSRLATGRLEAAFGVVPPHWRGYLYRMIAGLAERRPS